MQVTKMHAHIIRWNIGSHQSIGRTVTSAIMLHIGEDILQPVYDLRRGISRPLTDALLENK